MIAWSGLGLLVLVGAGIVLTGLPAFVVLIAVASLGALVGLATGVVPFSLLTALPGRLVNLLDNDLLQALPLYGQGLPNRVMVAAGEESADFRSGSIQQTGRDLDVGLPGQVDLDGRVDRDQGVLGGEYRVVVGVAGVA